MEPKYILYVSRENVYIHNVCCTSLLASVHEERYFLAFKIKSKMLPSDWFIRDECNLIKMLSMNGYRQIEFTSQ